MAETAPSSRRVRRDGVLVEGPDAASWLQGQLSQDVEGLGEDETRLSLVLSPQGRLESFCRLTRLGEESYLLDTEAGFGPALFDRLRRFKLRVKLQLSEVAVVCTEEAGGGLDPFGPPSLGETAPLGDEDEAFFETARIKSGRPRLGLELTEKTIPQEAGTQFVSRTVSFTKGCYTGQELVARLDSRGSNVPRRLRLLEGLRDGPAPQSGAPILREGAEIGQVTSASPSGGSFVALGYVKRSALSDDEMRAFVRLGGEGEAPVLVRAPEEG
jgi:folate-binding protein YgfZ